MSGEKFRVHRTRVGGHLVATDLIDGGEFIAYRLNDFHSFDFEHIAFGHGSTRTEAIEDLTRRMKRSA